MQAMIIVDEKFMLNWIASFNWHGEAAERIWVEKEGQDIKIKTEMSESCVKVNSLNRTPGFEFEWTGLPRVWIGGKGVKIVKYCLSLKMKMLGAKTKLHCYLWSVGKVLNALIKGLY